MVFNGYLQDMVDFLAESKDNRVTTFVGIILETMK